MKRMHWFSGVCAALLCLGLVGCESQTAEEMGAKAGAAVDNAVEKAGEAAKDAASAAGDAAKDAGDALKDAAGAAGDAAKDGADAATGE